MRVGNQLIQRVIQLQTELQKRNAEIEQLRNNIATNEIIAKENVEKISKNYMDNYQETLSKAQLENDNLKSLLL